jgi:glutamate-5-semialdehyde dehydrogenase
MKSNELKNIIAKTKEASMDLLELSSFQRKKILLTLADQIEKNAQEILAENQKDILVARKNYLSETFIERLTLNKARIAEMARATRIIAKDKDYLFKTISRIKRPSGIEIKKIIFPLGFIAIIYESRPNVTVDAFSLCFKSGNAVILKGGKEIENTNKFLIGLIKKVLKENNLNPSAVNNLGGIKKEQTLEILHSRCIDCAIPRGGKNLIEFVSKNAQVPVIITGASVVHTYVDKSADLELAKKVILNAKGRRVSICNALDVVLLHESILSKFLVLAAKELAEKNIELRVDNNAYKILRSLNYPNLKKAIFVDFDTEFLDYILAIKTVKNFDETVGHIQNHSLGHSEAIITKNKKQVAEFYKKIDAACLYHNTSTQFGDGGEYGMGGEIGISTQKLHARGPFSYRELTTYKYLVESDGAIRN